MLNSARKRFTAASRSTSEICPFSTAAAAPACSEAPANTHQQQRDGDIDQRSGDGDQEFLARLFRNALELRDAADRQQRDVGRRHAEITGGEDVAELVQQHAE